VYFYIILESAQDIINQKISEVVYGLDEKGKEKQAN
jgi:hypothetical protein